MNGFTLIMGALGGLVCFAGIVLSAVCGRGTAGHMIGERFVPGGAAIALPALIEAADLLLGPQTNLQDQVPGWVYIVLWACSATGLFFVGFTLLQARALRRPRRS